MAAYKFRSLGDLVLTSIPMPPVPCTTMASCLIRLKISIASHLFIKASLLSRCSAVDFVLLYYSLRKRRPTLQRTASQLYFLPYSLSMKPLALISSSKLESKKSAAFAPLALGFGRESKTAWSPLGSGIGYSLRLFNILSYACLAALGSFKPCSL